MTGRRDIGAVPTYGGLRMTIPARELLQRAGNRVTPEASQPHQTFAVTLGGRVPAARLGLTLVLVGAGAAQHRALRLASEPAYPGEWPDGRGIAWHERGDWVPCPRCGCALVWHEAGYVPGWRICTNGHHAQLADDGRSARPAR